MPLGGGLFGFIVFIVLRKVAPLPGNVRGTYSLLGGILIGAFVIALIGMCLFGIFQLSGSLAALSGELANTKALNISLKATEQSLAQQNEDLQGQVKKIRELELKGLSSSVEVIETDIDLDLTRWTQITDSTLVERKESLVVLRTRRSLWKAKSEYTTFPATYGTSSKLEPEISSDTHKFDLKQNLEPIPPNKEVLRRWVLWYDISREAKFQPFDIRTTINEWNSMQNPHQEHRGTLLLFPTRSLSFTIRFPQTKHSRRESVECFYYGLDATSKIPIQNPKLNWAEDDSSVTWIVENPRLLMHYEIWWKW